jgi:hypothetical protein
MVYNLKYVRNLDTWCPHCSIGEARKIVTKNKDHASLKRIMVRIQN